MNVAQRAGECGYSRIVISYARTDTARNMIALAFLEKSTDPEDTLIMLDNDHNHPADILERLAAHDEPVVGGLAFRRGEPFDPCMYVRESDGSLHAINFTETGMYPCDAIGHAAIAIKRKVFEALGPDAFPWWRYEYTPGSVALPSEDLWFSRIVREAGLPIYCDTSIISPHYTSGWVDDKTWGKWLADHPELIRAYEGAQDGQ